MEERLRYIFTNINDWLKFAETKNAALLVTNSAGIFAFLSFMNSADTINKYIEITLYITIALLLLSILVLLFSFVPILKIPILIKSNLIRNSNNILFYGDIAKYDTNTFLKKLYEKTGKNYDDILPIEKDYSEQIIVNSRIALRKYICFNISAMFTFGGIVSPLIGFLLSLITSKG